MSSAGRCIARNTSSGIVVGPGIARNSRPARTVIFLVPLWYAWGRDAGESAEIQAKSTSFRDGALAPDPESRDSGFDASHRPGMTEWIASSRSLSSGARSRDPLARNDGGLFSHGISDRLPALILD